MTDFELQADLPFHAMAPVKQRFTRKLLENVEGSVRDQMSGRRYSVEPGDRIAVAVGSRGIGNLALIVKTVVDSLKEAGAKPFILPAMGSHGGASADGQVKVLSEYGVTPQATGVPVEATMEVVEVSKLDDGTPVLVNKLAMEADGIILVNRIKPHTSFRGRFESGLMKMMTIGLGSHRGATIAHSRGTDGLARLIPEWGDVILRKAPILMGVAIIENAYEETARVEVLGSEEIPRREPKLLEEARSSMPRLLIGDIDLLIVDEIGKDISGTGMDTNVIGRMMLPGVKEPDHPGASRIVALDLSERTNGNANGMGLADVVTRRLFDKIDFKSTYANVLTSTFLNRANVPVVMETDRDAIAAALTVLGLADRSRARVVRIKNTLSVGEIQISEPLLRECSNHPRMEQSGELAPMKSGELAPMKFGADGSLS